MLIKMFKEIVFKIVFEVGILVGKGFCNCYYVIYYVSEGIFNIFGGIGCI